jgi:hypothetical protein
VTLYHYTCHHARSALGLEGDLLPIRLLVTPGAPLRNSEWRADLVWLTDLGLPIRDALGLTRLIVKCDRTAYRYRVTDEADAVPWTTERRQFLAENREQVAELERAPGARPAHWFVARKPVPVVLDQVEP